MLLCELTKFVGILDSSAFHTALESATARSNQKRITNSQDRFGTAIYNPVSMNSRASLMRRDVAIKAINSCSNVAASNRLRAAKMTQWSLVVDYLLEAFLHPDLLTC
jgi:aconitase A